MSARIATLAVGALLLAAGCQQDPYVIVSFDDAGAPDVLLPDTGVCVETNGGVEKCDGVDNDCDNQIDEDFNLKSDPGHCGRCNNSCLLKGAITKCELGKCMTSGCAPGFYDKNQDLNQDDTDGCEYACTPTGSELCDGKDNDCNGEIDETFTLDNDVNNCGTCGNACLLANAISKCVKGKCEIQACKPGFIDKDKKDGTGCETVCNKTNGGVEKCDGVDNDCNGVIDDPGGKKIDFATDPLNCGGCGVVCVIPNATATCVASTCTFSGCVSGFVNADGDPANGCECQPTGVEKCDGLDNDCNGKDDDSIPGYPGTCGSSVGACKQGTLTCQNGVDVCTGKVDKAPEMCDGVDNDCNKVLDPPACVFAASGRELRLDQPGVSTPGSTNSAQLDVAGLGDRVIAVWLDRRNKRGDIFASLSTDGGKTWSASDIGVAIESGDKLEPRIAFGGPTAGAARVYVAYERIASGGRDVYLRRSLDGGKTFQAPVKVNASSGGDALFVQLGVLPASTSGGNDRVVVCWEEIAVKGPVSPDVYCNLSVNSGQSFAASDAKVNNKAGVAIVPVLAVDGGHAHVAWQQEGAIWYDRAAVTGTTLSFGIDRQLTAKAGQEPRIAADGSGAVVVVWEDLRDPLINIRANRSTNAGASWLADGVRVDNDVVNGDSTSPAVAVRPGGRVFVAWSDTSRGKQDIYVNYSDDSGKTWGKVSRRVDADKVGSASSYFPHVTVDPLGKNVYVAWEDYRTGPQRDIYLGLSLDDGKTWNVPDYRIDETTAGKADARSPFVVAATSRVCVLWLDNRASQSSTGKNADVYASYLQ